MVPCAEPPGQGQGGEEQGEPSAACGRTSCASEPQQTRKESEGSPLLTASSAVAEAGSGHSLECPVGPVAEGAEGTEASSSVVWIDNALVYDGAAPIAADGVAPLTTDDVAPLATGDVTPVATDDGASALQRGSPAIGMPLQRLSVRAMPAPRFSLSAARPAETSALTGGPMAAVPPIDANKPCSAAQTHRSLRPEVGKGPFCSMPEKTELATLEPTERPWSELRCSGVRQTDLCERAAAVGVQPGRGMHTMAAGGVRGLSPPRHASTLEQGQPQASTTSTPPIGDKEHEVDDRICSRAADEEEPPASTVPAAVVAVDDAKLRQSKAPFADVPTVRQPLERVPAKKPCPVAAPLEAPSAPLLGVSRVAAPPPLSACPSHRSGVAGHHSFSSEGGLTESLPSAVQPTMPGATPPLCAWPQGLPTAWKGPDGELHGCVVRCLRTMNNLVTDVDSALCVLEWLLLWAKVLLLEGGQAEQEAICQVRH